MADMQPFDLLVVGGGINGSGIARDAAGRGLSVLLVEQDDLAAHTSSASTKLIHGGLRYLEYREFRLVRESLRERGRLLGIAPHIIRPLRFVLPHVGGLRPRWQIRLGLFIYDHSGGRRHLPASTSVTLAGDPLGSALRPEHRHGFAYSDCWVDDSRLVVLNALDAAERGAQVRTRTRLLHAERTGVAWEASCEDVRSGAVLTVRARAIVNAAGPWVDEVLRTRLGVRSQRRLRHVQGSHIVVPRLYDGAHAYLLQNRDRRIVFAIPYEQDFTLIGTTDVPYEGDPAKARISPDEVRYLCAAVSHYFLRRVRPKEVVHAFAGVRALLDDEAASASAVTRDYALELDAPHGAAPLLSVFGGKITTYRRLAEAALDKLAPHLPQPATGARAAGWTAEERLPGGDLPGGDFARLVATLGASYPFLSAPTVMRLARCYGTRALRVLGTAPSAASLGEDFGEGLTRREVDYLVENEWARTGEDILWRRTKLALHAPPGLESRLEQYLRETGASALIGGP